MSDVTHTPGPWHVCGDGKCSCFTVMCGDHPIAEVKHGDWGDDYPSIRIVGDSSFDRKAEAFMEQITYGSIDDATARANWHLIAAAPDLLSAAQAVIKQWDTPNWKLDEPTAKLIDALRQAIALATPQRTGQ